MNKKQKEVVQATLDNEKKVLASLKKTYKQAEKDIDAKIEALLVRAQTDTENLQSIIYQVDYQKALKKQVSGVLDQLNTDQFSTISDYLTKSYEDGFIGTLYDLQGQGIPLIFPIDQEQVKKAIVHDTKLSKNLYSSLGEDVNDLKKRIQSELSRGISQSYSYAQIAKNISNQVSIGYNRASRIARTEGHRIQQEATYNAQKKAKEAGADVVKQWDAALDSRTRKAHSLLDGQIRELDDPFEVNGMSAMYPGGFGVPSQDIHCRCVVLQRARWALDEEGFEEHTKFSAEDGVAIDLSDAKNYADFKKKYNVTVEKVKTQEIKTNTWTMNQDGTFSKGIVKNEAQYKIDLDDDKVLTVDVTSAAETAASNATESGIIKKAIGKTNKDLADKLTEDFQKTHSYEKSLKNVLEKEGYKGINVINNSKTATKVQTKLTLYDTAAVKKTKKSKFETLSASLVTQQKKLAKVPNKTYSGIWYNQDVSVSDYGSYKDKIAAKKAWYLEQLEKPGLSSAKAAQYKKYLDDLDEFEKLGKEYEAIDSKIAKINKDIEKVKPKTNTSSVVTGGISDGGAYSQARKDNAYWFTNRNGGTKGADAVLRDKSGEVWRGASTAEKDAIYEYTRSYSKFNEPLRGIEYGTNKYLGVGKVDLETIGVNSYGNFKRGQVKKLIDDMTNIIDRSVYDGDIWLQRGVRYNGMDKFFGINSSDFYLSEKQLATKLVGTTPTEYGFMSTAVSKGKGFSGDIILNIYAPRGTKMMYVEPFSAFGSGSGRAWDGISKQTSFGHESEMILQRNTQFRVTKVEKSNGTWYIDMEIIGQGR